jgi:hypothetical protein
METAARQDAEFTLRAVFKVLEPQYSASDWQAELQRFELAKCELLTEHFKSKLAEAEARRGDPEDEPPAKKRRTTTVNFYMVYRNAEIATIKSERQAAQDKARADGKDYALPEGELEDVSKEAARRFNALKESAAEGDEAAKEKISALHEKAKAMQAEKEKQSVSEEE